MDPTCVLCIDCFKGSVHKEHSYRVEYLSLYVYITGNTTYILVIVSQGMPYEYYVVGCLLTVCMWYLDEHIRWRRLLRLRRCRSMEVRSIL